MVPSSRGLRSLHPCGAQPCQGCAESWAPCTASSLWVPSQYGGERVRLHPHSQTVLSSSGMKRSGEIPGAAFLWAPSQKGCEAKGEEVKGGGGG